MRPFNYFKEEDIKKYDIRTSLYDDVWLSKWELKLIHTRQFQRLYDIRQLCFADKVFPDATHCRFNHSIGVLEQADRITRWVLSNLSKDSNNQNLENQIRKNINVIRMVALLHDVFHMPFGHTIEDELQFFKRHDEDPERKIKILDFILAEILYWEYEAIFGADRNLKRNFWLSYKELNTSTLENIINPILSSLLKYNKGLKHFLTNYVKSCEVLLFMGSGILVKKNNNYFGWDNDLIPLGHRLLNILTPTFKPLEEYYITDIIGNTISADLLDYALRDMKYTGLKANYDNRLLQYFTVVSFDDKIKLSVRDEDTGERKIVEEEKTMNRIAINLYDRRIRIDALSEILQILNLRYLLTERVLFHRTKCAVSAMLGKVIQLLELSNSDFSEFIQFGDSEFLTYLENRAIDLLNNAMESKQDIKIDLYTDTIKLIQGIRSRHYYKPVFHMKSLGNAKPQDSNHPAQLLADWDIKSRIEKEIEDIYGFPNGSVIIYCPKKTHLKEAECLVIVDRAKRIKKVKDLFDVNGFEIYGKEARTVAEKYGILWNMYVFVPKRYIAHWKSIENKIVSLFHKYRIQSGEKYSGVLAIEQDDDLRNYLETEKITIYEEFEEVNAKMGYEAFEEIIRNEEQVTLDTAINQRTLQNSSDKSYVERIKSDIKKIIKSRNEEINDEKKQL